MSWGVLNAAMLAGLAGVALPVIIHLLNRRQDVVIDWGAMQFLELGKSARRRIHLAELLLLLTRMGLLALAALAAARPFFAPESRAVGATSAGSSLGAGADAPLRDVVLVLDGSASMERHLDGSTPRARAIEWARRIVRHSRPGDTVALLVAGLRVRRVVDPPSYDPRRLDEALAAIPAAQGPNPSDLPAAIAEALRILEKTQNPERLVVVLTDGQRHAWRPGDIGRWSLVRDLHRRLAVPPAIWSLAASTKDGSGPPNASVGPLKLGERYLTSARPVTVAATVANYGPGQTSRTAVLRIDGRSAPTPAQLVGPIDPGGRAPVTFRVRIATPGSHAVSVRLDGLDPLALDDESSLPVDVSPSLPVLLVEGNPGKQPFRGATDFLRAALAPAGDESPPVRARVITQDRLGPEALRDRRAVVLAGVDGIAPAQAAAVGAFVESGGGLLVLPGRRADGASWSDLPWMPARIQDQVGDPAAHRPVARPAPRTFTGSIMTPFSLGDTPALADVEFFAYRRLLPAPDSVVSARLDTGDPWIVERTFGRGRVVVASDPFDADHGTLPVNPDFVPMAHELMHGLASGESDSVFSGGQTVVFPVERSPPPGVVRLPVTTPGGGRAEASVIRERGRPQARLDQVEDSGLYRLSLPEPPGASVYAVVAGDPQESDLAPLDPDEAVSLARDWPLVFAADTADLEAALEAHPPGGRHEMWRALVLVAVLVLCAEVFLTRRIVRGQGHEPA